ncbi:hypothetical protein BDW68DRAFT_159568 [Aspergillus falconensis]
MQRSLIPSHGERASGGDARKKPGSCQKHHNRPTKFHFFAAGQPVTAAKPPKLPQVPWFRPSGMSLPNSGHFQPISAGPGEPGPDGCRSRATEEGGGLWRLDSLSCH